VATDLEGTTGLTTAQAAGLAGVSEKSVRNWLKAGHLKPLATTQGRRIDKAELLDYLRGRAQATISHLPPELRPEATPESEPTPESSPNGHYVEETAETQHTAGDVSANPAYPALTPETINIVLQPLLERLNDSEKERRRLHDENIELAGRVGYYQAELAQYKDRVLLLEAPKLAPVAPVEAPQRVPWYKRLFALE